MKWLFGLLVLANVGLYMWGRWYHQPLVNVERLKPRPSVAADKMKLLSEPGAHLIPRAQAANAPNRPDTLAAGDDCFKLGPFSTLEKVRAAAGKLDIWGIGYVRLSEFETLGPSYRVYLPPLPSKEAAERKRRELTKLGFSDHALIQQEEGMENAISLGIFSVEQNAITRVQQLARRNITALIQPIPNMHPLYWLALSPPAIDDKLGAIPVARFREEDWGTPNVSLRPAICGIERAAQ
jgi:SPOR domain